MRVGPWWTRRMLQRIRAPVAIRRLPRRVVFLHIPKTAGTSVNDIFLRRVGKPRYGSAVVLHDRADPALLELARGARFVGGHFGPRIFEEIRGEAYAFTFLREPVARLISTWRYLQSQRDPDNRLPAANLGEALTSDHPDIARSLDNVMTRQLGAGFELDEAAKIPRDEWLDRAKACLARMDYVAFTARIDADLRAIGAALALPIPGAAPARNRTDDPARRDRAPELSVEAIDTTALPESALERFTSLDRDLWSDACERYGQTDPEGWTVHGPD